MSVSRCLRAVYLMEIILSANLNADQLITVACATRVSLRMSHTQHFRTNLVLVVGEMRAAIVVGDVTHCKKSNDVECVVAERNA